mgnify:FL=1
MSDDRAARVLDAASGKRPTASGWVRADCPFCESRVGRADRHAALGLSTRTGWWHCFRCGARGRLDGDFEPGPAPAPPPRSAMALPAGFVPLYDGPGRSALSARPALDYLAARGLPEATGRAAGIGVVLAGPLAHRVVVPVRGPGGELLGWSARSYGGGEPKYLYPPGMARGATLYNAAALAVESDAPAYVTEGVFDALALWPDAVACLGKPGPAQVALLRAARRPLVALLDGDAWRESEALAARLRLYGCRAAYVRLPPRTDPATADLVTVRATALLALGAAA